MASKVILISHNKYAQGLKQTLEMITGVHENLYAFGLMPGDHPDEIIKQIEGLISPEEQMYILGDIAGGSVCNAALRLTQNPNIQLIAGMNLPLVMQLVLSEPTSKSELLQVIEEAKEGLRPLVLESITQNEEDFF
ncbi:PTS system, mannose-specific IIA component [Enterococcus sp. AZ194]|uniref:PTS sugar transporter subunit IIA n=1 Tax=Enterococcus sp. AZ194 TaxID=2774629 RepID=UPI003F1FD261